MEELALCLEDDTLGKSELRDLSSPFKRNLYFCVRKMSVKKKPKQMKQTRKHAWSFMNATIYSYGKREQSNGITIPSFSSYCNYLKRSWILIFALMNIHKLTYSRRKARNFNSIL